MATEAPNYTEAAEKAADHRRTRIFDVSAGISKIIADYVGEFELHSEYDREREAIAVLNTVAAAYGLDRYIVRPEC